MARRVRACAWYRVLPLVIVALFGAISFTYTFAPSALFQVFYPLDYEDYVLSSAQTHGVDPYLVAAVIKVESNWDDDALSSRGAEGLMQLMPETAQDMIDKRYVDGARYSASNLFDAATNIEFGCAYLSYLLTYFNGATDRAIAAYNAGMGNVDDWAQEDTALHNAITFPETQAYLFRVTTAQSRYEDLYPELYLGK